MVNEAKKNEAEDRKRRELVEARNNGDTLAYTADKALRDLGDKVPGHDRQRIEKQIADLREALKGEDLQHIRNLSEQLQQATYALNQQMYASGASGTQSGGNGGATERGAGSRDGDVVEGEFTEA